jgi:hypothetical protein
VHVTDLSGKVCRERWASGGGGRGEPHASSKSQGGGAGCGIWWEARGEGRPPPADHWAGP